MTAAGTSHRITVIDMARFYAIALVFYGHFVEEFMLLKSAAGAAQYKFIYSFHMVLFILIAGYVSKASQTGWPVGRFLTHRFYTRLLPFLFFTALMMIPPVFLDGKFFGLKLPSVAGYGQGLVNTAFGLPSFCIPSWFLLLIVGVELLHYAVFRFLGTSNLRLLVAIPIFYLAGYQLNLHLDIFNPLKGRTIGWNYFFIHEAVTLYSVYLLGIYLRRRRFLMDELPVGIPAAGAAAGFLMVLFTYTLNTGPFNFHVYNTVVILFASHGHILLFPLTALAGCAMVLCLARLTPAAGPLTWLGGNTLILMCLNGIFYHFVNPPVAKWALATFPDSAAVLFAIATAATALSLLACAPVVYWLNRYLPQLVGKPGRKGPLLGKLLPAV